MESQRITDSFRDFVVGAVVLHDDAVEVPGVAQAAHTAERDVNLGVLVTVAVIDDVLEGADDLEG